MTAFTVLEGRLVAQSVVVVDHEPAPSPHNVVVQGVPKRTVEAALSLYLRAHGHLAEVAP